MNYKTGGKATVFGPTAVGQGVTGPNMRDVLGVNMFGVISAFAAVAFCLGANFAL